MIFSTTGVILTADYDNIEVEETEEGTKKLILTQEQFISLANYMEEQETKIERLEAELAQAKLEIEKAYESEPEDSLDLTGLLLKGGALATIIIALNK